MRVLRFLVLALLLAGPVFAVQPDEVLDDPALEARARSISQDLRCPICQGENIDESNAAISRDLRLYVRERLVAGDTDREVIVAVTDRFGEFVLFDPPATGANLILWFAGPVMALLGLLLAWRFVRQRPAAAGAAELTAEERARLSRIMQQGDGD